MNLELKGRDFSKNLTLKFVNPINTQGLSYWFSDLNYDADKGIISGYFNYALCVKDLYSCRILFGK
jgi:hypothetical protein